MNLLLILAIANVTISTFTYVASYIIKPQIFAPYRQKLDTAFASDVVICGLAILTYLLSVFLKA